VYQFVRLLACRHSVSLLTYGDQDEAEKVAAIKTLGVAVHIVPRTETSKSKRLSQLSSLFSKVSYQRRSLHSPGMQERLDELLSREHFDVIQVESSQLGGLEFNSRTVLVLDEHNIEYELLHRMYLTEGSAIRKFYNWLEFKKFKREEVGTWRDVSGCVSTSTREEQIIRKAVPGVPTATIPNAVDTEYFHPSCDASIDEHALVMTGLMHYRPNVDGALYFLQEIFPHILAARPKMVFYIVGAGAPAELKRLASPNVVVTDTVPDVRPYVHQSAVFVVPLRMGGGTRLKVLEGLSMEKAVVSTSVGCEGIDVTNGEHLLIADEPHEFARSVLKLACDQELAVKLGRQGRLLVERHYNWETVVARLETFYGCLLATRSAASQVIPKTGVAG
jgi:glycosyltransferase involved in cell wall biosynthesis